MKIWCWLCFGEEEEHNNNYNYKRELVMEKEGTLVNSDVDEGKHEELGFCNFGGVDGENVQMQLGSLEEGSSNLDVGLNLGSSSLAAGSEMEGLDRGGHCKRPKVNSLAM
ncbi:hypothetical protein Hanom_Chr03g00205061 [Helianthus anomalus]